MVSPAQLPWFQQQFKSAIATVARLEDQTDDSDEETRGNTMGGGGVG